MLCPTVGLRAFSASVASGVKQGGSLPARNSTLWGTPVRQQMSARLRLVPALASKRCNNLRRSTSSAALAGAAHGVSSDGGGVATAATPPRGGFATIVAIIRAVLFYITTFVFATPLFVSMLAVYPYVLKFDHVRRRAQHAMNTAWAKLSTVFYYPVEIEGQQNLPAFSTPAVYVSNHQSFLDIYTLFHLHRDFKFISKTSNFLIPIIGWSMFLTGHVMINRLDRRSQLECLKQCSELLKHGASVLFFPEGTRSKDGRMHAFKRGAFSVAAKAKVPVVPITLIGTGDLMPNTQEYLLFPGKVKLVIHPAIVPKDAATMAAEAYAAISSSLPPELVAPLDEK
uniref:1-acyl-sn-glycerol-3-phosphate acyltransferase n=1 Tax=Ettlia oleoabundans TaxID=1127754 RepID=A0A2I7YWN3_9CHLO|nr:lysophosphatidic acid acyltransferase [Ettlia oleoabundans]